MTGSEIYRFWKRSIDIGGVVNRRNSVEEKNIIGEEKKRNSVIFGIYG